MPVYLFTVHAFRSWNAGHPRGYVQQGKGILPPNPRLARHRERIARHERTHFGPELHAILIDGCRDVCSRRNWRLHQVIVVSSHIHALVSWRDGCVNWQHVRDTIKRLLGWMLAKHTSRAGRRWFSRKGSRKRVRDRGHFAHLTRSYLPAHARGFRGGSGWCEQRGHFGRAYDGT
jgi:REP element-mobilizing transposase RayT